MIPYNPSRRLMSGIPVPLVFVLGHRNWRLSSELDRSRTIISRGARVPLDEIESVSLRWSGAVVHLNVTSARNVVGPGTVQAES